MRAQPCDNPAVCDESVPACEHLTEAELARRQKAWAWAVEHSSTYADAWARYWDWLLRQPGVLEDAPR